MKRKTLFFLLGLLFLSPFSIRASIRYGGLHYHIVGNYGSYTAEVTYETYNSTVNYSRLTTVIIPKSIIYGDEAYKVTSIGPLAFKYCSGLTSITIPNSVTSIRDGAFSGCTGLTSITIPESVTSIGDGAFSDCSGLTSVVWNAKNCSSSSYNDDAPFYAIRSQITSFTFGDVVEHIPAYLCYEMSSLTSITIPESVTSIDFGIFLGCSGLTSIVVKDGNRVCDSRNNCNAIIATATNTLFVGCKNTIIPNTITSIGDGAFNGCTGLTSITIPESVTSIGDYSFKDCTGLTSVTIPNSVTSIGDGAFTGVQNIVYTGTATGSSWGAKNLNRYVEGYFVYDSAAKTQLLGCSTVATGEIIIPESVTSIGYAAFYGCTSLTSITIPESVTSIGYHAFDGTFWYESQPDGVVYINDMLYTYKGNKGTMSNYDRYINVKKGTKRINQYAFAQCTGLRDITIPESVTSIGKYAFYSCTGLTSITIPEGVTYIGDNAFRDCTGLTRTYYKGDIAGWCNIDFDDYTSNPIAYSHNLFLWNASNEVTNLVIPNGVTSIKNFAFDNCDGLTSVIIPESVTNIGESAFYGCTGLTSITCKAIMPPVCGYNAFYNVSTGIPVNIPCGTIDNYQTADYWKLLSNLQEPPMPDYASFEITGGLGSAYVESRTQNLDCNVTAVMSAAPEFGYHFVQWSDGNTDNPRTVTLTQDTMFTAEFAMDYSGKCGDNLYWQYQDNELRITGSGTMYNYTETTQPWLLLADSIYTIYIDNTVTSIGEYAFANLGKLTKLHLGAGLENIGANAFAGCLRLGNIHCYAALPPLAEESSFANYNARLYVPCEVVDDYRLAIVFGNFKYIDCISSDGVDVPNNTVTVTPSTNDATFTWPSNNNANAYTLEITKDGMVFCTLTFNANGQLMGIAFAPSKDRNNAHAPQAAQATVNGWQFTVTGLNESSNYAYTMTVADNSGTELQTYNGTFRTLGTTALDNVSASDAVPVRKIFRNGQVLILRGNEVYTVLGEKVE